MDDEPRQRYRIVAADAHLQRRGSGPAAVNFMRQLVSGRDRPVSLMFLSAGLWKTNSPYFRFPDSSRPVESIGILLLHAFERLDDQLGRLHHEVFQFRGVFDFGFFLQQLHEPPPGLT